MTNKHLTVFCSAIFALSYSAQSLAQAHGAHYNPPSGGSSSPSRPSPAPSSSGSSSSSSSRPSPSPAPSSSPSYSRPSPSPAPSSSPSYSRPSPSPAPSSSPSYSRPSPSPAPSSSPSYSRPSPAPSSQPSQGGSHYNPPGQTGSQPSQGGSHYNPPGQTGSQPSQGGSHYNPPGQTGSQPTQVGSHYNPPGQTGSQPTQVGSHYNPPGQTGSQPTQVGSHYNPPGQTGSQPTQVGSHYNPPGQYGSRPTQVGPHYNPYPSSHQDYRQVSHVPYSVSYETVRWQNQRAYQEHMDRRYIFRSWIQEPVDYYYNNGYQMIDNYPYYVDQGIRYRYNPVETCDYHLVDSSSYSSYQDFGLTSCTSGYDQCAAQRDSLNNYASTNRYFCSESVDPDLQSHDDSQYSSSPVGSSYNQNQSVADYLYGKSDYDLFQAAADSSVGNCSITYNGRTYVVRVGHPIYPYANGSVNSAPEAAAQIGCNVGGAAENTGCILRAAIQAGYCF
jgi:hypothetical protein